MSSGVPKSANARMNTSREAARMVGMDNCMITLKNRFTPVQPMFAEASIKELSIDLNAPFMYTNTSGKNFSACTIRMPPKP